MKFKSRKDIFFKLFFIIMISILLMLAFIEIYFKGLNNPISIFITVLILSIAGLFIWTFLSTEYELTQTEFKYKSGPIKGEVKVEKIKEIIKGKTLWSGTRPATAKKGLTIKYGKYDEIYISPKSNDIFIEKILELNKDIKISST